MKTHVQLLAAIFALSSYLVWDTQDGITQVSAAFSLLGKPKYYVSQPSRNTCNSSTPVIVAGTIQNSGSGWEVLEDSTHAAINVSSVETTLQSVKVHFTFKAIRVIAFIAAPDEQLASNGFHVGARVGLGSAAITASRGSLIGNLRRSPLVVSTQNYKHANIWFYGIFEAQVRCD